jgi:Cu(I)/Ag(I) efflux system membrane protein CusA/SilA
MNNVIDKLIEFCARNKFTVIIIVGIAVAAGIFSIKNIPLDAIPDLSDTQVIVCSKWDRPPQIIEDQVTYPIVTALLGAPKVKDIRAFSDYGYSYVYVIFEDGTDVYWARSRVLEYLSKVIPQLPKEAEVQLGPDASGVGWVLEYALVDKTGQHTLHELTTFQNWHLKYALQSVKGVAEVATVGGFVKQYQVVVNPNALVTQNISINDVVVALKNSNQEVGARLLESAGKEYMVTARGYIKSLNDIRQIVLRVNQYGVPVKVGNVARVQFGPDIRRGVAELDGKGEVVGGIVVMRYGENALDVIKRVKNKLSGVQLPQGLKVVITYDRSELILRAIRTLKKELSQEMLVVSLIILIFLMHLPSALIPIIILPVAVIVSFIPMYFMRLTSNVMSLGGIAIAIGAMVDASIVVVENSHKKLSLWEEEGRKGDYHNLLLQAIKEVGPASFFSLLVISVSFLPIFTLEGIEGRLFKPLAFTKNFAMFFAAVLSVTLAPAIIFLLIHLKTYKFRPKWFCNLFNRFFAGEIRSEEHHPVSRFLFRIYTPAVHFVLNKPRLIIWSAIALFFISMPLFLKIGKEFMPPLNEGTILYMPTTPPGISIAEATKLLQVQDKILKTFPEVISVFGKAGRADSSTDPAPFSMMETIVVLKPQNEWRYKPRWYSNILPNFMQGPLRVIWPDRLSYEELIQEMDEKLQLPGQVNAWTMPIKARIDMLTTGVRTPAGIKIYGDDLNTIEGIGVEIENYLRGLKGTRSIYAERTAGGYFINFHIKRDQIARYGLTINDVQMTIMSAIGGENVTETIEGRERFPVNVRYPRGLRDGLEKLRMTYITTPQGASIPVMQLADISAATGAAMIRDENAKLTGYIYVDVAGRDIGSYVTEAKEVLKEKLKLPPGYTLSFSGQYEYMQRVKERMKFVLPLTLLIIIFLLRMNTGNYVKTLIVLLAVPFSLIGVVWTLFLLKYNLSIAVWAGIIALLGLDAETGVFMLLYLDLSYEEMKQKGVLKTIADLKEAIMHGAVKRIRPKMMTVATTFIGLMPIMWAQSYEIGADVTKRIAAPMIGGLLVSFVMELVVYPAIYFLWKKKRVTKVGM